MLKVKQHFWKSLDLALYLTENFRMINSYLPVTIVYDMDDILWPLARAVAKRCNIEYDRLVANYHIHKNRLLSQSEQKEVIAAFSDPNTFKDIKFFPGVTDITRPRELGAKVLINSSNLSPEIAKLKKEQLLATVPDLAENELHFDVIEYGKPKTFRSEMTIFVDDSPHNVKISPALINIMPKNIAWSCNKLAQKLVVDELVFWRPSLIAINQSVYDLTKLLLTLSKPFS